MLDETRRFEPAQCPDYHPWRRDVAHRTGHDPLCDGTGTEHGPHDCTRAGEGGQCLAFCERCA